jgi:zinc transporter ZupT
MALPTPTDAALGLLTGIAGGVLAYVGAAHLLPEAQAERPSRMTAVLFAATLVLTTAGLMTILSG